MPDSMKFWMERLKSPLGNLRLVASNKGIRAILWESDRNLHCKALDYSQPAPTFLTGARRQLNEYFLRKRTLFELPLDLQGTPFQLTVWKTLLAIPYGRTLSYEDLAINMGDKNLRRAVGAANSRNPVPIVVPCHRVIGKDGSLTGFTAGIRIKKFLLDLEGSQALSRSFGSHFSGFCVDAVRLQASVRKGNHFGNCSEILCMTHKSISG